VRETLALQSVTPIRARKTNQSLQIERVRREGSAIVRAQMIALMGTVQAI
jgi:hypothetical protein